MSLFLLGADEIDIAPGAFVVYIGTHGDRGAHRADVILPGAAYTEKSGIYVNTEGRVQMAARAAFPPGDAREDWAILRALSDVLGQKLPYDSLGAAARRAVQGASASRARSTRSRRAIAADIEKLAARGGTPDKAPFRSPVADFYLTNPIARASAIMAECSALARGAARADGGGVAPMAEFWTSYLWPLIVMVAQSRAAARHPAGRDRLRAARRPQDLGGGADPARAERGRAVGPAAVLRRPAEVRPQGADRSRPAPTRACSCWRRWSPACSRSPPGR